MFIICFSTGSWSLFSEKHYCRTLFAILRSVPVPAPHFRCATIITTRALLHIYNTYIIYHVIFYDVHDVLHAWPTAITTYTTRN